MHAFSMAESTDFGILRLIVSDVEKSGGSTSCREFCRDADRCGMYQLPECGWFFG